MLCSPPPPTPANSSLLLFFLLLLFTFTNATNDQLNPKPRFREAPQFYNSPNCPPPLPPSSLAACSPPALLDVALTLDVPYLRGSAAAIHSILRHSSCPQSVRFHFLAANNSLLDYLNATVSASFPSLSFRIYPFDSSHITGLISASLRSALDRPLNYARSYLARLLPDCVRRVAYLDSDLVLVEDIQLLSRTWIPAPAVLAAPEYCNVDLKKYFTPAFWSNPALSMAFEGREACYFNTGVMVMDLARWRAGGFTSRIEEWMELQKRMRIYELGSLPPFLLEFAGRIVSVDRRWNQHGLGGDNFRGLCRELHPGPASLLHWSGKGKPWDRIDSGRPCPLDALWAAYDLLDRS